MKQASPGLSFHSNVMAVRCWGLKALDGDDATGWAWSPQSLDSLDTPLELLPMSISVPYPPQTSRAGYEGHSPLPHCTSHLSCFKPRVPSGGRRALFRHRSSRGQRKQECPASSCVSLPRNAGEGRGTLFPPLSPAPTTGTQPGCRVLRLGGRGGKGAGMKDGEGGMQASRGCCGTTTCGWWAGGGGGTTRDDTPQVAPSRGNHSKQELRLGGVKLPGYPLNLGCSGEGEQQRTQRHPCVL